MININNIKQANVKMLERLFLIDIANEQDSIIKLKDKYINQQNKELTTYKTNYGKVYMENIELKSKQSNKIKGCTIGGFIVGFILSLLIQ